MLASEEKAGLQAGGCLLPCHICLPCWEVFQNLVLFRDLLNDWKWNILKGVRAQSLQLCLTLCDPMDYSLPGSSVHGIIQERMLEWVAMPSSSESFWPRDQAYLLIFLWCVWRACSQFWVAWNRLPGCKPRAKSASLASIPLQDSEQCICLLGLVRGRKGDDVPVFDDLLHVFCTWVDLSLFAHCLATQLQCRAGQGMKLKLCSWWEWREAKEREREIRITLKPGWKGTAHKDTGELERYTKKMWAVSWEILGAGNNRWRCCP